jgi:hypothetical protein
MSGFNIVLPEHIWKPIAETGNPVEPWNQPNVGSGPWIIRSTASVQVGDSIWLDKNPLHYAFRKPLDIWTVQRPSTTPNVESVGHTHWLKKPATQADVTLDLYINNLYAYENGPFKENVFGKTALDGAKNVTLWKWTGEGCPNDQTRYAKVADVLINEPWRSERGTPDHEVLALGLLGPGYYFVKVEAHIDSLEYWDGTTWVTVPPANNPFYCTTITYKEFFIITSRYDFAGLLFKPCPPATPKYQPIPDITIDYLDINPAARSFGAYPGHARWNPACDLVADYFIDYLDINPICRNFGWSG